MPALTKEEWIERKKRIRERVERERMLTDVLRAKTPSEKKKVIESFSPYYFILHDNKPKES